MSGIYRMNVQINIQGNNTNSQIRMMDCDESVIYVSRNMESISIKYTDYFLTLRDKAVKHFRIVDASGEINLKITESSLQIDIKDPEVVEVYLNDKQLQENLEKQITYEDFVIVKMNDTEILNIDWK